MLQIVVIEKNGTCSTEKTKNLTLETLYKKCKFRKSADFEKRATWKSGSEWVSIYARDTGRAGGENKFELPPPIDKNLYFGKMAIIKHSEEEPSDDKLLDFTKEDWDKVYEKCMGGFEDLGSEDTEEEEEEIPEHFKTAQGYSKEDGFVVDDDEDEDDEDFIPDDEDDDDEDDEDADDVEYGGETGDEEEEEEDDDEDEDDDDEMECGSELSEEDYDYK